MAIRFKPPDPERSPGLLRQEQSRAAPTVGARRTSRSPGGGSGAVEAGVGDALSSMFSAPGKAEACCSPARHHRRVQNRGEGER